MPELSKLASTVADILKQRGDTIAVSESSCAGLLSAALVAIPGASAYYVGGAIIYTRVAQAGLLNVFPILRWKDSAPAQNTTLRSMHGQYVRYTGLHGRSARRVRAGQPAIATVMTPVMPV